MKRVILGIGLILISVVYAREASGEGNLVKNGDFEIGDGLPTDWVATGQKQVLSYEKAGGKVGEKCIKVENAPGEVTMRQEFISLSASQRYKISAYLKAEGFSGAGGVTVINEGWTWQCDDIKPCSPTTDWVYLEKIFTPGPSSRGKYHAVFYLTGSSGKIWADGIKIEPEGMQNIPEAKEKTISPVWNENLITNPGFEKDSDRNGVPDGWELTSTNGASGRIEEGGHEGKYCMVFDSPGGEGDCYFFQRKLGLKPNTDYTLSFWYKTKRDDPWGKGVIFLDKEENLRDALGWTKYIVTMNSGDKAGSDLQFFLYHRNARLYIDEVRLEEGKEATPFSKEETSAISPVKKWSASEILDREKNKPANPNLLKNASFEWKKAFMSFEETAGAGSYGWGTATDDIVGWDTECRNGKVAYVGDISYDSWTSVLFYDTIGATGGRKGYEGYIIFRSNVRVEAGKQYTLSAAMKTENLETPEGPYVGIIDAEWVWEDIKLRPEFPSSDWKVYAKSFVPPPSSNYQIVVVMCPQTKGKVWFDAIKLEEGNKATAFVDTPPDGEREMKIENPIFKELISSEPSTMKEIPYWAFYTDVGRLRNFAKKFAHRYVYDEQWKEASDNNLIYMVNNETPLDECIKQKVPFIIELGGKSDAPLIFGEGDKKRPWLLDPKVQDAYIKSVSENIQKYQSQGLWGLFAGDEIIAYLMTNFVPEGAVYDAVENADKEIKGKYGFGKFGIPLAPAGERLSKHLAETSPQNPYVLIAYRRWVNDKMTEVYKKAYEEAKKLNPNIIMLGEDSIASVPGTDWEEMSQYFDAIPFQTLNYLTKVSSDNPILPAVRNAAETKAIADLSSKPVLASVHNADYMGSPTAEEIRERFSQVFRNGGEGILLLAVEWFDREMYHPKFCATERWKAILEICNHITTMNKVKIPKDPDVAILYPTYTLLGERGPYMSGSMYGNYAVVGPLTGAWFNFVSDRQIERGIKNLGDFKLLYIPYCRYERPAIIDKFIEFLNNGGTIVMTDPQCFMTDINGDDITGYREKIFGVKVETEREMRGIDPVVSWYAPTTLPCKGSAFKLTLGSNVEILAKFSDDNSPAITLKKYGKGKAIFFAYNPFGKERNIYPDAPWVKFFTALQKEIGIKMNRDIWRFKFPQLKTVPIPVPQSLCLTENNVFFDANCPLDRYNMKTNGTYSYSVPPSGNGDVVGEGEILFARGHLTDRPRAANNRILGRWVSASKAEVPRWTVSWTDNKETAITFDLKKSYQIDSMKLFYSDQLPEVVIEGSLNGEGWDKLASSGKEEATQDVLDKIYPLKGRYQYLRLNLKERDQGKPMTLIEVEIWGKE